MTHFFSLEVDLKTIVRLIHGYFFSIKLYIFSIVYRVKYPLCPIIPVHGTGIILYTGRLFMVAKFTGSSNQCNL